MKKDDWIQSDFTFEELVIGMEILNHDTKQLSRITEKTANSIEVFNRANQKSRSKIGQLNSDGEMETKVRLKGVDSLQWYTLDTFNRKFERVDLTEHKFKRAKEWLNECISKQKWTELVF